MTCNRLIEIIEDDNQRISSTKVCVLLGQVSACAVIAITTWRHELQEGLFSLFLLYSGGLYGLGRVTQSSEIKARVVAENPAPALPAVVPVPVAAPQPVTINMNGNSPAGTIQGDANLTVEGDANVNKAG